MLLQKTGLRIKKFISQKKDRIEKPRSNFDNDDFTDNGLSPNTTQRLSWLSQTSSAETPLKARRASSNITTRSNHFTPSSKTAHSSASSLCSCDCEANPAPVEHSLFGVDPLPPHPEILYLPPLPSGHTAGDAKTWSLIFQEPLRRPLTESELRFGRRTTSAAKFGPGSPFDVSGVLSADLLDDDKTPTQSLRYTGSDMENPPESVTDSVEQLIRETDMAFQAVGTALADSKAATEEWHETGSPLAPRSSSVARVASKRQPRPVISPLKTPVTRAMSVSRGKKSRFGRRKATLFGKSNPRGPPSSKNTPARWTLTDATTNMADLFSGKMFRTEVDEMLTPGRIQQLKDKHESERKISMESAHSYETDSNTPTETFRVESLSSRITAAQQEYRPVPSSVLPPPVVPPTGPRVSVQLLPPRSAIMGKQNIFSSSRDGMIFSDLPFPQQPPPIPARAPRRSSASTRATPLLPTISEISPLHLPPKQFSFSASSAEWSRPSSPALTPPTHIILPSTHYTLTSPLFRHGPIRLERLIRDRKASCPDDAAEALDWTAFQMAISGTMQDGTHDMRDDSEWEADEAEIDGIVDWYRGFGFRGYGRIETEADVRARDELEIRRRRFAVRRRGGPGERRSSEGSSSSWSPSRLATGRSWMGPLLPVRPAPPLPPPPPPPPPPRHPMHSHSEQQQRMMMAGRNAEPNIDDIDNIPPVAPPQYSATATKMTTTTIPSSPEMMTTTTKTPPAAVQRPRRRPSLAESVQSLPPSPMLDLVVSGRVLLPDGEVPIPMGFNLGHDLGDFLSWEARHVKSLYMEEERGGEREGGRGEERRLIEESRGE